MRGVNLPVVVEVNPSGALPVIIQAVSIPVGAAPRASRKWPATVRADPIEWQKVIAAIVFNLQLRVARPGAPGRRWGKREIDTNVAAGRDRDRQAEIVNRAEIISIAPSTAISVMTSGVVPEFVTVSTSAGLVVPIS